MMGIVNSYKYDSLITFKLIYKIILCLFPFWYKLYEYVNYKNKLGGYYNPTHNKI